MRGRRIVASALVVVVLMGFAASVALAQPAGGLGGGRGARGGRGGRGGRGNWDPAQMQQRYMERIKKTLKVGEEEWVALQPKVEKVVTLSRDLRSGRMRGMMARRRPEGAGEAPDAAAPQQPPSEIQRAYVALQKTLENEAATDEEIAGILAGLRAAREKARQELAAAQKALSESLTPRREAQLVLMGLLE